MALTPLSQLNEKNVNVNKRGLPSFPGAVLTSTPYKIKLVQYLARNKETVVE